MATINVKQAADRVGVSQSLIYLWCMERRLPHLRLGKAGRRGKILISDVDLDAFLTGLKVEAGEGLNVPSPALKHITQK